MNVAHTSGIKGMTTQESTPILDFLSTHQVKPELTCRFSLLGEMFNKAAGFDPLRQAAAARRHQREGSSKGYRDIIIFLVSEIFAGCLSLARWMQMAQLVVRNLEEDVKARLKQRALRHGRSMEEEVRLILNKAAAEPEPEGVTGGLGSRIATLFSDTGLDGELPELKKEEIRPMKLGR